MGKVPDQPFPYSDHEGLAAVYEINRSDTGMSWTAPYLTHWPLGDLNEIFDKCISSSF